MFVFLYVCFCLCVSSRFVSFCVFSLVQRLFCGSNHDLDSTDLRDVVVHASLVELHLVDEVGVFLSGFLLAFVVLHEHLRFDFGVELLVLDLVSGAVELVHTLVVEPALGLQGTGGDRFTVLIDFGLAGLLGVGQRKLLKTFVDDCGFARL